jgi:hypothetical protein
VIQRKHTGVKTTFNKWQVSAGSRETKAKSTFNSEKEENPVICKRIHSELSQRGNALQKYG